MVSLDVYTHYEIDNDGEKYRFKNRDVVAYCNENKAVNKVFKKYEKKIIQTLFIKWNWLYFTFEGIKFYHKISSSSDEYKYIDNIVKDLYAIQGIENVAYEEGVLD